MSRCFPQSKNNALTSCHSPPLATSKWISEADQARSIFAWPPYLRTDLTRRWTMRRQTYFLFFRSSFTRAGTAGVPISARISPALLEALSSPRIRTSTRASTAGGPISFKAVEADSAAGVSPFSAPPREAGRPESPSSREFQRLRSLLFDLGLQRFDHRVHCCLLHGDKRQHSHVPNPFVVVPEARNQIGDCSSPCLPIPKGPGQRLL